MFKSLAEMGINVEMVNTSEVRVNVIVDGQHGKRARDSLTKTFADAMR
jgi:aspartate kinase